MMYYSTKELPATTTIPITVPENKPVMAAVLIVFNINCFSLLKTHLQ